MKSIIIAAAVFVLPFSAMAQGVPGAVVPSAASLATGVNQLRVTGSQLIGQTAVIEGIQPGLGVKGRQIIEAGTGPNGIIGTTPAQIVIPPVGTLPHGGAPLKTVPLPAPIF